MGVSDGRVYRFECEDVTIIVRLSDGGFRALVRIHYGLLTMSFAPRSLALLPSTFTPAIWFGVASTSAIQALIGVVGYKGRVIDENRASQGEFILRDCVDLFDQCSWR